MSVERNRALKKTLIYALLSGGLYYLLYHFEASILELSKQGRWYFIVPLTIAFVFSIVHGNFTGQFWELFGIRAKTTKK
ncbi:MAG: hypothetical protein HQL47_07465 [Gammaproteobacteria bacterium]|nr:hypothetical protein [Gammaproteobacteria bacterium]